jgi:hypothetical protein
MRSSQQGARAKQEAHEKEGLAEKAKISSSITVRTFLFKKIT